jgi:hypothetical protein
LAGHRMSPLESILRLFASHQNASWNLFAGLPLIEWRDVQPSAIEFENPQERTANNTHVRNGNLLLLGFGDVDMPDAELGCDSVVVKRNEGHSSLALIGDAAGVHWIVVQKFYPSHQPEDIIHAQWVAEASANRPMLCRLDSSDQKDAENTLSSQWKMVFNDMPSLCLDFFVDALGTRYSPGTTTLIFHKPK